MAKEFTIAEGIRIETTNEQVKQIRDMYKELEKEFKERIRILSNRNNISSVMRTQYLNDFTKELQGDIEYLNSRLEGTIVSNMEKVAEAVVNDANNIARDMGFGGVFTSQFYVPVKAVNAVTSGKLYEGKWTLSKAIWSDNQKKLNDINYIVGKGLAGNKSTYEIAKDLERYVNPNARKLWDWSKVYPGTSKKIDYNAQRLARTMISHAYEEAFVESTKDNPFIESYMWLASGGDRMCDICAERDGKIFPKDELPLDHPNGMCTFEVVIEKSYKEIASDLRNWVNGTGDSSLNEQLDDYAETLGYNVKDWTANTQKVQNANAQNIATTNNIVNGTDISDTWQRRPDQFAFEIEDVINAQGFDGLPRVVNAEEFDRYVKESNLIMQRGYTAPDQETLIAYQKELYQGKWYVDCKSGGHMYGRGMYADGTFGTNVNETMEATMKSYGAGSNGKVETFTLTSDAKILDYKDVDRLRQEYGRDAISKVVGLEKASEEERVFAYSQMGMTNTEETIKAMNWASENSNKVQDIYTKYITPYGNEIGEIRNAAFSMDEGVLATLKGYDAINCENITKDDSDGYFVILNRTKCIFKGE